MFPCPHRTLMDIRRVLRRSTEAPCAAARRTFIARVRAPPAVHLGHWDVGCLQFCAVVRDTPDDVCFQLAERAHVFGCEDVGGQSTELVKRRGQDRV